jgi:DNA repair protein RadA/Sms
MDRVLGGGLVPGQVILLAGEPGIGKSTILLQLADKLGSIVYVSGEESASQVKIRATRLNTTSKTVQLYEDTDVDSLTAGFLSGKAPNAVFVDSIQTITTSDLTGVAGSVGQVRESAARLVKYAKSQNVPVVIVGHVTKDGTVAGPKALMHIVDTVLWFEGDNTHSFRLIRAVKNRFGPTDEVGIFEMTDKGLLSANDPQKQFLSGGKDAVGRIASVIMQGTRPVTIDIESLVVPTKLAFPKRTVQGIDSRRFEILLAVMQKALNLPLYNYDCYLSVSGGLQIKDTAADLAICMAVVSSLKNKPFTKTAAIGEVSLLGDIKEVPLLGKRLKEAKSLGYANVLSSKNLRSLIGLR